MTEKDKYFVSLDKDKLKDIQSKNSDYLKDLKDFICRLAPRFIPRKFRKQ